MQTTLSFPPGWADIPYGEEGDDPQARHEFLDLRSHPEQVGELPEVHRAAGLRETLLAINGAETIFRTFGCDFAIDRGEFGEGFTHAAHSYLHVGFADLALCEDVDRYYLLFGRLAEHLHGVEGFESDGIERFFLDFGIEELRMAGERKGAIANVSCDVLAPSEGQARADWGLLMSAVATSLARERSS